MKIIDFFTKTDLIVGNEEFSDKVVDSMKFYVRVLKFEYEFKVSQWIKTIYQRNCLLILTKFILLKI